MAPKEPKWPFVSPAPDYGNQKEVNERAFNYWCERQFWREARADPEAVPEAGIEAQNQEGIEEEVVIEHDHLQDETVAQNWVIKLFPRQWLN